MKKQQKLIEQSYPISIIFSLIVIIYMVTKLTSKYQARKDNSLSIKVKYVTLFPFLFDLSIWMKKSVFSYQIVKFIQLIVSNYIHVKMFVFVFY